MEQLRMSCGMFELRDLVLIWVLDPEVQTLLLVDPPGSKNLKYPKAKP